MPAETAAALISPIPRPVELPDKVKKKDSGVHSLENGFHFAQETASRKKGQITPLSVYWFFSGLADKKPSSMSFFTFFKVSTSSSVYRLNTFAPCICFIGLMTPIIPSNRVGVVKYRQIDKPLLGHMFLHFSLPNHSSSRGGNSLITGICKWNAIVDQLWSM